MSWIRSGILLRILYIVIARNFSAKIKKAAQEPDTLPTGYGTTGFQFQWYDIYMKPISNQLLFYTIDEEEMMVDVPRVLQDGMDYKWTLGTPL